MFKPRHAVAIAVALICIGATYAAYRYGLGANLVAVLIATLLPLAAAIAGGRQRWPGYDCPNRGALPWLGRF